MKEQLLTSDHNFQGICLYAMKNALFSNLNFE